jgi:hypothetical protein
LHLDLVHRQATFDGRPLDLTPVVPCPEGKGKTPIKEISMSDFQAIADRVEIEALRGEFTDAAMMRDRARLASLFTPADVLMRYLR